MILANFFSPKLGLSFLLLASPIAFAQGVVPASQPPASTVADTAKVAQHYGRLSLSFEANQGQADKSVRFLSRGNGYSLFLTDSGAALALTTRKHRQTLEQLSSFDAHRLQSTAATSTASDQTDVIHMELSGASPARSATGENPLPGTVNYLIGNDPSQWRRDVPTYARVRYAQVYPGVDLVYYGNQTQLEYDFILAPNADPRSIRIRFAGAEKLTLDAQGNLIIAASHGQVSFHKPTVYQERKEQGPDQGNAQRQQVAGSFALLADHTVGFTLGSYDHALPLVIDPLLAYSSYLGGNNGDYATAIAVDREGNAYVTGLTGSSDFPVTADAFQTNNKSIQVTGTTFVAKLNPAGTALLYSTLLGGTGLFTKNGDFGDISAGIAVDDTGSAYIVGAAYSKDFPLTANAFQKTQQAATSEYPNAFFTKLNPAGDALVYSTYLGGGYFEKATSVAVDASGNAYVAGNSGSTNFPTTSNAFQKQNPSAAHYGTAAFVAKFNPTSGALIYSTLLGGGHSPNQYGPADGANGIAVDSAGSAYVTGSATSTNFPVTPGAFQPTNRGSALQASNAFITKLNPEGSGLAYSTYIGGTGSDTQFKGYGELGYAIALDKLGNAYITGLSYSPNFPVTENAFQKKNPGYERTSSNAFVAKLNATGTGLVYASYLGGSGIYNAFYNVWWGEYGYGIAVDSAGNAYVTGDSLSPDFPLTENAYQTRNKSAAITGSNVFITEFDPTGSVLSYSTYFGGSDYDTAAGIALDGNGGIYVTGLTGSRDFPVTSDAFQIAQHGSEGYTSAFITKLNFSTELPGRPPVKLPRGVLIH